MAFRLAANSIVTSVTWLRQNLVKLLHQAGAQSKPKFAAAYNIESQSRRQLQSARMFCGPEQPTHSVLTHGWGPLWATKPNTRGVWLVKPTHRPTTSNLVGTRHSSNSTIHRHWHLLDLLSVTRFTLGDSLDPLSSTRNQLDSCTRALFTYPLNRGGLPKKRARGKMVSKVSWLVGEAESENPLSHVRINLPR